MSQSSAVETNGQGTSPQNRSTFNRVGEPGLTATLLETGRAYATFLQFVQSVVDERMGGGLNGVQALLLWHVSHHKGESLNAGQLRRLGYYQGSNVSYNLKKMVIEGYLTNEESKTDGRQRLIGITDKGRSVAVIVSECFGALEAAAPAYGDVDLPEALGGSQKLSRMVRDFADGHVLSRFRM